MSTRFEYEGQARLGWTGDAYELELVEIDKQEGDRVEGVLQVIDLLGGGIPARSLNDVLEAEFETVSHDNDELLGRLRITVEQLEPPKEPPPAPKSSLFNRVRKRRTLHSETTQRIVPPGETE